MKARKKPVVVDVRGPLGVGETVHTANGPVAAFAGDYIVTAPGGDTWPINGKIFEATYEIVEAETARAEG